VFDPGGPGADCDHAELVGLDETHGADITGATTEQWWKISGLTSGSTYHMTVSNLGGFGGLLTALYYGDDCAGKTSLSFTDHFGCFDFTMGAGTFLYIQVHGPVSGTTTYTFNASAGGC
jgi:hypothetical protein